jgi:RNA polymerase sigma-70 factor (ECF subfamily)
VLVHLDAAWNLARWLLDSSLAEEAVQEACLKAFKAFDKRTGPNAKAWFLAIVRNCCMDVLRGLRHQRWTDPYDDEVMASAGNERFDSPEAAAVRASEARWLQGLIDELPSEYREVLVLRELEDLSYKEISEIVRVPIGTVMSRLARVRDGLADKLGARRAEARMNCSRTQKMIRNHPIDLYVWPGDIREATPLQVTLHRGFGIAHWSENGLHFAAVSDVDPRDLERFARLFHSP